ncbi:MAG: sensor histidine kinase [Candidatus Thiodiazotropha sp.]
MKNYMQTTHSKAVSLDHMLSVLRYSIDVDQKTAQAISVDEHLGMSLKPPVDRIDDLLNTTLPKSLINSEEAEKKRISQELHDGLGQILTSINLHVQQCLATAQSKSQAVVLPEAMTDSLLAISNMAKQAMGEVRAICSALRPAILDDLGVLAAISWQCRQISQGYSCVNVETDFEIGEDMIPECYKTVLYRVVQEGLNNAVKYSKSEAVRVSLRHKADAIELGIQDFGVGFDLARVQADRELGMGLISMRERVESVGGVFEIDAGVGRGVEIRIFLPMEKMSLTG